MTRTDMATTVKVMMMIIPVSREAYACGLRVDIESLV